MKDWLTVNKKTSQIFSEGHTCSKTKDLPAVQWRTDLQQSEGRTGQQLNEGMTTCSWMTDWRTACKYRFRREKKTSSFVHMFLITVWSVTKKVQKLHTKNRHRKMWWDGKICLINNKVFTLSLSTCRFRDYFLSINKRCLTMKCTAYHYSFISLKLVFHVRIVLRESSKTTIVRWT